MVSILSLLYHQIEKQNKFPVQIVELYIYLDFDYKNILNI